MSITLKLIKPFLTALMLLLVSHAARADISVVHLDLVCYAQINQAQIRFSIREVDLAIDSNLPQPDPADCTLANGNTVRVRGGEEQAFGYGAGGGNPPAFFSLWINQRKIFSRKVWKPGYEKTFTNPPIYDIVLIESGRITICATAEGKPQKCSSQPLSLAKVPIDDAEYGTGAHKLPVGHFSVVAKGEANQRFCEAYLGLIKPGIEHALQGGGSSLDIAYQTLTPEAGRNDKEYAYASLIDQAPGATRRLMLWSNASGYFDGEVMVLAPPDTAAMRITAAYPFEDIDGWPNRAIPEGYTLISGGQKQLYPGVSPRYVHLVPQRIDGALYVLAFPTNHAHRPTAALVKPLAEGGFVTLCAFNRTEPHY